MTSLKSKSFAFFPVIALLFFCVSPGLLAADPLPQVYVPDGQLLNRPIQVYISSTNLNAGMTPVLRLIGFYPPASYQFNDTNVWTPYFVAGGQTWNETVSGQAVSRQGTFLLFDLSQYSLGNLKSTTRVTPILTWVGPGGESPANVTSVVGDPVYLGQGWIAACWTVFTIGILSGVICWLCKIKTAEKPHLKGITSLISGPDNYMSLWRTQLVAWTLAVGSMVFFFGVIQLRVPQIPDSLVALMGMSVATGGLSSIATRSQVKYQGIPAAGDGGPDKDHQPEFSDLISSYNIDLKLVVLSVPKAQMLFWTVVILILFITKSLLTGELWDVPWELVALTGVSQAGYISDKTLQGKPASPAPGAVTSTGA